MKQGKKMENPKNNLQSEECPFYKEENTIIKPDELKAEWLKGFGKKGIELESNIPLYLKLKDKNNLSEEDIQRCNKPVIGIECGIGWKF